MIKRIEYIIKHNLFIQKIYTVVMSMFFKGIGLFVKVDKKQILFSSLIGKSFGDSPKVLYDAMRSDEAFKGFKFVWAFDDPDRFDVEGAKKVKLNSLKYFIETLRSGVWITNVSIERGLKYKPKSVLYIDTWHGIFIKVAGNAQKNRNDYDYSNVDFMCVSSEFEKEILIRDFKIRKETLVKCGMPRNDFLYTVTDRERNQLRKQLNIPDGKKVILYAPTWRDSDDGGASYQLAPPIDIKYWERELGGEYVVLFKMHHLTTETLGIQFNDFVRDVSSWSQINTLMPVADIILSDYSSTVFDYSIMERPIISFAYDLEEFSEARGFYEDLEKDVLPGCVFKTQQQVIQHIKTMDYKAECEKARRIKQKYVQSDGHATKACIDYIKQHLV